MAGRARSMSHRGHPTAGCSRSSAIPRRTDRLSGPARSRTPAVKPANIILGARGGEFDVAKVVDFGVVTRLESGDGSLLATIDRAPGIAGTPCTCRRKRSRHPITADL